MTEAATTTAAATATTEQTTAATTTAAAPWHGFAETDAEAVAYVGTKGWKGPQDVIKSYQNAERLIGKDPNTLLVMPRADDPAGFKAVMAKLGLPESPDKYEFSTLDGVKPDDGYTKWARDTFHGVGLTAGQVKELTAKHNEYVKGVLEKQTADYNLRVQAEKSELLAEWGAGHERMQAAAEHAANALGFKKEVVDAIEAAIGYKETKKLFADLGKKMGEDKFVAGEGGGFSGQLTPAEAKAQYDAFVLDPNNAKALIDASHPGHKGAIEKKERWFAIMYPQKAA